MSVIDRRRFRLTLLVFAGALLLLTGAALLAQSNPTPTPTASAYQLPTLPPARGIATVTPMMLPTGTLDPTQAAVEARQIAHRELIVALADGRGAYEARCAPCHGLNGEGIVGPSFRDLPLLTEAFVLDRVRRGPEVMSAFSAEELPDALVSQITTYLQTEIVGKDVPAWTEEEIAQGRELYIEYCRECHAAFGQGRENLGPAINRWPPMSITRIVEGGLLPLPNMPRLPITPEELRLVAAYVQHMGLRSLRQ